jgi:ubiquinol-cytochrome c reductase cytochrome c1 subunit
MMRNFAPLALGLALTAAILPGARAAEEISLPKQSWSFDGAFGTYDRASAQRGFQVYNEVCSACHAMKLMSYRNLAGIGLSAAQIKAIAASKQVPDLNDSGEPTTRPGLASDHFVSPFPNDRAAKAANGVVPPDQSVLLKAREGGPDYIYAILTGYNNPPDGIKVPDGVYYNSYFPGHLIHMPAPLSDGQVTYADGTKASVEQMARDVTTFLAYASEPHMEERKRIGVRMLSFLVLLTGVAYAAKRRVWAKIEH